MELFKIGCIDKDQEVNPNSCKLVIKLPTFKNQIIWTLTDGISTRMLGYHEQQNNSNKEDPDLERLYELLRFDPLEIRKYGEKDKELLRRSKKYYKHQSDKLLNYMFAIDWTEPQQVQEAYTTLNDWTPMKPT